MAIALLTTQSGITFMRLFLNAVSPKYWNTPAKKNARINIGKSLL